LSKRISVRATTLTSRVFGRANENFVIGGTTTIYCSDEETIIAALELVMLILLIAIEVKIT
jgi:hypothetical protein